MLQEECIETPVFCILLVSFYPGMPLKVSKVLSNISFKNSLEKTQAIDLDIETEI
jgi:hypothetical protein